MAWTLQYAVRSDRGLVRSNNEDSVYAGPRLLAVADGMGGHAAGEVASKLVIAALERLDDDRNIPDLISALRDSVSQATASLAAAVRRDPDLDGMGTTLTALRFAGTRMAVVHVGDSRAYLYRNGHLSQITHDDTYVQSLVDAGELTSEEASHHPRRSVILRALNGSDVDPDISIREARIGDRYLICSDGLSDVVSADTLLDTLSSGTPQGCADRLIELALRGGGPDNVTVVVADVVDAAAEVDNVPLVGGAVIDDFGGIEVRPADSPAARAALIGRDERSAAGPTVPPPRRSHRKALFFGGLAFVVLVAGAVFGYRWTQGQYYVGRSGDIVAIYRGIGGDYGPFRLNSVVDASSLRFADLNAAARSAVTKGITAQSKADAEAILARLTDQLLPPCVTQTPSSSPSSASPSASATTPGRPTATPTAKPSRSTSRTATRSASPTTSPSSTPVPTPTHTPIPGVDCRPT